MKIVAHNFVTLRLFPVLESCRKPMLEKICSRLIFFVTFDYPSFLEERIMRRGERERERGIEREGRSDQESL